MKTPTLFHNTVAILSQALRHVLLIALLISSVAFGESSDHGAGPGERQQHSQVDLLVAEHVALVSQQDILRIAKRGDHPDSDDLPWLLCATTPIPVVSPAANTLPGVDISVFLATGSALSHSPRAPPHHS